MSFKQRLKSSYTMTRFEFSWKMIPESRSRDRKRSYIMHYQLNTCTIIHGVICKIILCSLSVSLECSQLFLFDHVGPWH